MRVPLVIRITAAVFGLLFLMLSALRTYIDWANSSADTGARALCEAIRVGDQQSTAMTKAATAGGNLHESDGGSMFVTFPGSPMEFGVCYVDVAHGKVVSTRFEHYDPD